jgi:hypothetical protein
MLTHIGTDITGRPVFTTLDYWADAFALAEVHVKIHGPIALMWNGVPAPVFPGQTAIEWWIDQNCRADALRSGRWPCQIAPFSPEVDPFKVTPLPEIEDEIEAPS